jgi:glycosyltransferase involved in cell wall biosynthesis
MKNKLLLIGPLPPPMGGDTEHFSFLTNRLKENESLKFGVFNTSRGNNNPSFMQNLKVLFRLVTYLIWNVKHYDIVSLHASDRGMFFFGPIICLYAKLFRKKTLLRLFGGSFNDFYNKKNRFTKILINRTILSADIILMQTKRMIKALKDKGSGEIKWFSTHRTIPKDIPKLTDKHEHCHRFLFLGHLWKTKGIETILEISSDLPEECKIDLYGPLDEYSEGIINSRGNNCVKYCGLLSHSQVYEVIQDYQCLILPTYHDGEGYPGVIIEAFFHGLPVITTNWLAIPEIVDRSCGILINPKAPKELAESIRLLNCDRNLWKKLSAGAKKKTGLFDPDYWSDVFYDVLSNLSR